MRRTENRATERIPIELWVQELREDRVVLHPAANLSAGGLFLYARGMREGETRLLEFSPPGSDRAVRVRARVAWRRAERRGDATGVGIEFIDLAPEAREAIARSTHAC